jgi:hypothetical protein
MKPTKIYEVTPREWDEADARYIDPYDMRPSDPIDHPDHYTRGEIETWDYIASSHPDGGKLYFDGTIKKYMDRWPHKKKPLEDLRKAKAFLDKLIEAELANPTVVK